MPPGLIARAGTSYSPVQVKSSRVKLRLAGRQPSNRGGVLRMKTGPFGASAGLAQGKAPNER